MSSQTLAIWALLVALSVLEQLVEGLVHDHSFAAGIAEVKQNSYIRIIAQSLILLLVQLPYVAFRQLSAIMGPAVLRQMFFSVRRT